MSSPIIRTISNSIGNSVNANQIQLDEFYVNWAAKNVYADLLNGGILLSAIEDKGDN